MNLLLFKSSHRQGDTVVLSGRRAEHIRNILRLKEGDSLRVGEINGLTGKAVIRSMDNESVRLSVALSSPPPQGLDLELILALPRPIMLQRILKQATTLGVRRFHLIRSRRVEKSFFHSPVLKPEKIEKILIEGLEQAMDTYLPEVLVYHRFKPFVEDILPTLAGIGLLAHPTADRSLSEMLELYPGPTVETSSSRTGNGSEKKKILLAVGPEGGFLDYECGQFVDKGFTMVTMGPRILHVDTAVVALLAQLSLVTEYLDLPTS